MIETLDNGGNQNNPIVIVATAAHVYYNAFSGTKISKNGYLLSMNSRSILFAILR